MAEEPTYENQDILKEFQLAQLTVNEKSTPEFGLKMSKKVWSYVMSGLGGYYFNRNARLTEISGTSKLHKKQTRKIKIVGLING